MNVSTIKAEWCWCDISVIQTPAVALPLVEKNFQKWLKISGKDSNETRYSIPSIYTHVVFPENSVYIKNHAKDFVFTCKT